MNLQRAVERKDEEDKLQRLVRSMKISPVELRKAKKQEVM